MSLGSKIRRRGAAGPLAAAVLALTAAGAVHAASSHAASTSSSPACDANTTVQTDEGAVCGVTSDGITTYFSVPYAAAPVGNLRWRASASARTLERRAGQHAGGRGVHERVCPAHPLRIQVRTA